jgi:hypothetical protein
MSFWKNAMVVQALPLVATNAALAPARLLRARARADRG